MIRHICLDTETTGFDPKKGDRIAEIACIELSNYIPTGRFFHKYINPDRLMPRAAFEIHGLSDDFLRDKPYFKNIADEFIEFIQDSPLVIHNAAFDMKFLNAELRWAKKNMLDAHEVIDTLLIARKKFPGSPATLDALCKRFNISLENRTKHGALIDTELLAEVYLNLCDGRSPKLGLEIQKGDLSMISSEIKVTSQRKKPLDSRLTETEEIRHRTFIEQFKQKSLWLKT